MSSRIRDLYQSCMKVCSSRHKSIEYVQAITISVKTNICKLGLVSEAQAVSKENQ